MRALVQDDAAEDLDVVVAQADGAARRLADAGEGLGQDLARGPSCSACVERVLLRLDRLAQALDQRRILAVGSLQRGAQALQLGALGLAVVSRMQARKASVLARSSTSLSACERPLRC